MSYTFLRGLPAGLSALVVYTNTLSLNSPSLTCLLSLSPCLLSPAPATWDYVSDVFSKKIYLFI